MNNFSISKRNLFAIFLMALMVFPATEIVSQKRKKGSSSFSINRSSNNGKSTIHVKNNGKDFKIEYEGDFTISNDDRDITGISNGGFIEITKSSFGSRRRILIEADRSGNLIRKYYIGSRERDYEPEGREWLAEILPEVVRSSGLGAESRVARFFSQGGANAVLGEIRQMDSDYVKAIYFELLLERNLSNGDLVSVIRTAGDEVDSDHYLSEILKSNQKAFLSSSQTINAYINATRSIQSDHYVTTVLKKVINDSSISDSQMASLLDISKSVESDHYMTEILTEMMDNRTLNTQNTAKVIELSKDIESDHYKSEVLKKAINDEGMPSNAYDAIIGTMEDIQSDHYVTEVVKVLMRKKIEATPSGLTNLLNLVHNNVGSDHYASVIYKMVADQNLSEGQITAALNSASNINSDHYLTEVLLAFSDKVRRSSESVKAAYRAAAKSIGSDTYYGRASKAID